MDIVALSHLRWDFVYQRPQHLLSRAARRHRVLFVEEPMDGPKRRLVLRQPIPRLTVVTPHLPAGTPPSAADDWLGDELARLVPRWQEDALVVWHYAVMAEPVTRDLPAEAVVFDCMDELSLFQGAPPELVLREAALLQRADVVFTGGWSLWEAKRRRHPNVHAFPSSVDVAHFGQAKTSLPEPEALRGIGRPRFVWAGVIDERMDLELLRALAAAELGEVVLVGPIAKIDPDVIPAGPRIHRLGMQPYEALPAIFAHCDVGIMPFAHNDATRYISPTKTPEYLAAGLPVVSTGIADVVRDYGDLPGAVHLADGAAAFVEACERALRSTPPLARVDRHLAGMSWDLTWDAMEALIADAIASGGRRGDLPDERVVA